MLNKDDILKEIKSFELVKENVELKGMILSLQLEKIIVKIAELKAQLEVTEEE